MRLHSVPMELGKQTNERGDAAERRVIVPPTVIENPEAVGGADSEITAPGGGSEQEQEQDVYTRCFGITTSDQYGNEWLIPPPDGLTHDQLAEHIAHWAYQGPGAKPIYLPDYKYA
jgi:hypothetical protein